MLKLVIVMLVAAAIAALFGFADLGSYSWPGARNFCYVFLVLAAMTFFFGGGFGRRSA